MASAFNSEEPTCARVEASAVQVGGWLEVTQRHKT